MKPHNNVEISTLLMTKHLKVALKQSHISLWTFLGFRKTACLHFLFFFPGLELHVQQLDHQYTLLLIVSFKYQLI